MLSASMTSSEKSTSEAPPKPRRPLVIALGFAAVCVVGWGFILWQNRFHPTAPVKMLCLGWLAVITGAYFFARVSGVWIPVDKKVRAKQSLRDELLAEKRSLLKSIKEIDFDLQLGKMSEQDAQELTRLYRARAIEVMSKLDQLESPAGTVQEQIARELRARLALAASGKSGKGKKASEAGGSKESS
jgi:hypothetical protein